MQLYIATGNLVKDNELRVTTSGKSVVKNTLAIRRDKDNTDFMEFTCFGTTAELLNKYTTKGSKIGIQGEFKNNNYEKDGKKIYRNELLVRSIELLSAKAQKLNAETGETTSTEEPTQTDPFQEFSGEISDLDLPF